VVVENDIDENGKPKPASAWKRQKVRLPGGRAERRVIRPKFRGILDEMMDGATGGVLVENQDRLLRDPRDLEDLFDVCWETRAVAASLTGPILTNFDDESQITQARIMVAVAWAASNATTRRVTAAAQTRAEKGLFHGGQRRFGYEPNGVTIRRGEAAEVEATRDKVLAFEPVYDEQGRSWDRKGVSASLSGIVRDLNKRGVPTVHGGPWRVNTLKGVLMSPATAGIATYKGEVTKVGAWPGILTVDQHHQLVKILGDPARRAWYTTDNPGDGRGRPPDYLLSGRVDGQQLFTCGRVLDDKDTANYPHLFAGRVGEVCHGPVASAGSEKGGARTYGCRHCHRNSRLAAPVETLVDTIMRFWLAHRDELQARVAQIVPIDKDVQIAAKEREAERILADTSKTLAERVAAAQAISQEIERIKAGPAAIRKRGQAEGLTPAMWDSLDWDQTGRQAHGPVLSAAEGLHPARLPAAVRGPQGEGPSPGGGEGVPADVRHVPRDVRYVQAGREVLR
jgi:DNA invertase Pin-like site-specific DNA recombinase